MIPNFTELLEEVLVGEIAERKKYFSEHPYFHNPSSASIKINGETKGACLRQLYYRATKEPETGVFDLSGALTAGFGEAIHGYLLGKWGKSKKISLQAESKGKTLIDPLTREVSYRLDGLVSADGETGGLEIKTSTDDAIEGRPSWGIPGIAKEGPKEDHLLQVISYFNAFPSIKWFVLIYFGRGRAPIKEFHITRDGDNYFVDGFRVKDLNFKGISERWQELDKHLKDKQAPPRDYKVWLRADGTILPVKTIGGKKFKSDWRCNYCPFSGKCWTEPDAQKESYGGA